MKINPIRSYALGIAAALIAVPCFAAMQATPQTSQPGTLFTANANLMHPLNSNTARIGQRVTAKLTSNIKTTGSMDMPRGTILMGTVRQVQTAQNHGIAKIGIVFDHARLSNGREIPIKATLLGAYPADMYSFAPAAASSYLPLQPRTVPNNETVTQEPGTLSHITLRASAQSNLSGVFSSTDHTIKLNSGTRLQLAIDPEMSSAANGA